jgi:hypothetical protein
VEDELSQAIVGIFVVVGHLVCVPSQSMRWRVTDQEACTNIDPCPIELMHPSKCPGNIFACVSAPKRFNVGNGGFKERNVGCEWYNDIRLGEIAIKDGRDL